MYLFVNNFQIYWPRAKQVIYLLVINLKIADAYIGSMLIHIFANVFKGVKYKARCIAVSKHCVCFSWCCLPIHKNSSIFRIDTEILNYFLAALLINLAVFVRRVKSIVTEKFIKIIFLYRCGSNSIAFTIWFERLNCVICLLSNILQNWGLWKRQRWYRIFVYINSPSLFILERRKQRPHSYSYFNVLLGFLFQ